MKKRTLIILTILVTFVLSVTQLSAQGYKVIVNKSNTVSSLTKKETSRLFLKKVTKWDDNKKVSPVDLTESKTARIDFTKEVHGKTSINHIKAYWQKQIFSGRMLPPPEKTNDDDVVAYVKENPGAIGYVSASAVTRDVKVIDIAK